MRRTLFLPLLFLSSVLLLFVAFLFIECPAKKKEAPPAARTAVSQKPNEPDVEPRQDQDAARLQKTETPVKKAAVIIDDLGYSLEAARSLCSLKKPVTAAILPFAPASLETARFAHECGLEIMLHLPLESLFQNPEKAAEGMISAGMTGEEVRRDILACLERVPWSKGVNNHTGSKITEDAGMMPEILSVLKEKGLYFIDSRTSKDTVAFEAARRMGVRAASRQVFLDQDLDEAAIKEKLEELFRLAGEKGRAVGICHAKKETLEALGKYLGLAERYGVKLVFASEIVE